MGNNENVLFAALGEKDQTRTLSSAQSWTPEPNSKEQKTSLQPRFGPGETS